MGSDQTPRENAIRSYAVGVFLIVFGVVTAAFSYLAGIIPIAALGTGAFIIGILVLTLPDSGFSIYDRLVTDSSLPGLINIENLLQDLDVNLKGVYIPTSGIGHCPKVFLPLAETPSTSKPPVTLTSNRRIFVTVGEGPEDRGILLDAPGEQILSAAEKALGIDFANVQSDELQEILDSALRTIAIAKDVKLKYEGADVRIELMLDVLLELEVKLRRDAPRLVAQVGTPIMSALAGALSKSTGKYVTIGNESLPGRKLAVGLKLGSSGR